MDTKKLSSIIANLLNEQNQLSSEILASDVEANIDKYVVMCTPQYKSDVIAFAKVRKISHYLAEISHVSVNPEYQGQGYGKKILQHAENKAYSLSGVEMIQSTIRCNNEASISVFTHREWRHINTFVSSKTGNVIKVMCK